MKNIYFVILILLIMLYLFKAVFKSKLSVKESFFWIAGSVLALILAIFPQIIVELAKWMGISYPPSLLFVLCILFLLYLIFRTSKRSAFQESKIVELSQEVALLKKEIKKWKK